MREAQKGGCERAADGFEAGAGESEALFGGEAQGNGFEALKPLADVFSSKTGAPRAPSRPLPQAEATVFKENTSPLTRSLKKADVREAQKGGCERNANGRM